MLLTQIDNLSSKISAIAKVPAGKKLQIIFNLSYSKQIK